MSSSTLPSPWLTTPRLRLREFATADRNALVKMHKDTRVRAMLVDDYPLDQHTVVHELILGLQSLYRQYEGLGIWHAERMVVVLDASDTEVYAQASKMLSPSRLAKLLQPQPRFAGWFNLMPMTEQPEEVELGSRLLPEVWGTGLALEGGEQLLKHAFNTLGRKRVWAVGHIAHRSVRYCVSALGFEDHGIQDYEGKQAQYYLIEKAHWHDWQATSRKDRQRHAVAACKVHAHQRSNTTQPSDSMAAQ